MQEEREDGGIMNTSCKAERKGEAAYGELWNIEMCLLTLKGIYFLSMLRALILYGGEGLCTKLKQRG